MESCSAEATRLVLIRHGHVEDNSSNGSSRLCGWLDPPLSPQGRSQAAALAQNVVTCTPVGFLYASTLQRSHETAGYLAAALSIQPRPLRSLREIHCGRLEGWRLKDIQRVYPDLWRRNVSQQEDGFRWPGGESYEEFRRRVMRAIAGIAARHCGGSVAVVTHAGVVSQIFGALHGTRPAQWEAFRPSNASVSELLWTPDGRCRMVRFDEHVYTGERVPD